MAGVVVRQMRHHYGRHNYVSMRFEREPWNLTLRTRHGKLLAELLDAVNQAVVRRYDLDPFWSKPHRLFAYRRHMWGVGHDVFLEWSTEEDHGYEFRLYPQNSEAPREVEIEILDYVFDLLSCCLTTLAGEDNQPLLLRTDDPQQLRNIVIQAEAMLNSALLELAA